MKSTSCSTLHSRRIIFVRETQELVRQETIYLNLHRTNKSEATLRPSGCLSSTPVITRPVVCLLQTESEATLGPSVCLRSEATLGPSEYLRSEASQWPSGYLRSEATHGPSGYLRSEATHGPPGYLRSEATHGPSGYHSSTPVITRPVVCFLQTEPWL
jgi:hypothetical protein